MNKFKYDPMEEIEAQAAHINLVKTLQSMIDHCDNEIYVGIFENCLRLIREGKA